MLQGALNRISGDAEFNFLEHLQVEADSPIKLFLVWDFHLLHLISL